MQHLDAAGEIPRVHIQHPQHVQPEEAGWRIGIQGPSLHPFLRQGEGFGQTPVPQQKGRSVQEEQGPALGVPVPVGTQGGYGLLEETGAFRIPASPFVETVPGDQNPLDLRPQTLPGRPQPRSPNIRQPILQPRFVLKAPRGAIRQEVEGKTRVTFLPRATAIGQGFQTLPGEGPQHLVEDEPAPWGPTDQPADHQFPQRGLAHVQDLLRVPRGKNAAENGQTNERLLQFRGKRTPGVLEQGPHTPMAGRPVRPRGGQEVEVLLQHPGQRGHIPAAQLGSGHLQGHGKAVQPAANLGHGPVGPRRVGQTMAQTLRGPLEQPSGRITRGRRLVLRRTGETRQGKVPRGVNVQRARGRHQDPQS